MTALPLADRQARWHDVAVRGCATQAATTRRTVLTGLSAALATAGCARRDPDALTFWAISYEGDYSPLLMPAFTRATGVPVEVQTLPATAAHEKLLTAFTGGSLPDVMMLPNGWVDEFAMVGAVAPVADAALLANVFPTAIEAVRYRGVPHAVPWSVGPQMQFYRRDLLAEVGSAEPPQDWEGWRRLGFALKRRRPDDFAYLLLLNWWDALFTFIAQTGARPLRDHDTRGNFRSPAIRAALAFYVSLFADGLAPRVLSTEVQDPLAAFAQGYFAVYPSGPTLLLDLHRRQAEIGPERWAVVRMPGPHGAGAVSSVDASLAVARGCPRPEAAWALVRHLTSPGSEIRLQQLIGNLPACARAWENPRLAGPGLAQFAAQMRTPAVAPRIVEWERIRIEVQLVAERVVRGLLTIDAGLAAMDARVDALLAKRRALVEVGRIA